MRGQPLPQLVEAVLVPLLAGLLLLRLQPQLVLQQLQERLRLLVIRQVVKRPLHCPARLGEWSPLYKYIEIKR